MQLLSFNESLGGVFYVLPITLLRWLFKVPRALSRSCGMLGRLLCTPVSVDLLELLAIYVESNLRLLILGDGGTHSYHSILVRL